MLEILDNTRPFKAYTMPINLKLRLKHIFVQDVVEIEKRKFCIESLNSVKSFIK